MLVEIPYCSLVGNMTMDRSNATIDSLGCTQELFATSNPDDIFFDQLQLFSRYTTNTLLCRKMILSLDSLICAVLLNFDMFGIWKLNVNNLRQQTERRSSTNVKDNLVKDVYNLYSFW